jgi:hypothetical protein
MRVSVRSILFQWDEVPTEFLLNDGAVPAPVDAVDYTAAFEGELVVVTFSVAVRATALSGRLERRDGQWWIRLEARDFARLTAFLAKLRSPPSNRSPAPYDSVRDIRLPSRFPSAPLAFGPDSMFLKLLVLGNEEETMAELRELSSVGIVVEHVSEIQSVSPRLVAARFDAMLVPVHKGAGEAAWLRVLHNNHPQLLVVAWGQGLAAKDIVTLFESGADDFVERPLRPSEFGARLVAMLRKRRSRGPGLGVS